MLWVTWVIGNTKLAVMLKTFRIYITRNCFNITLQDMAVRNMTSQNFQNYQPTWLEETESATFNGPQAFLFFFRAFHWEIQDILQYEYKLCTWYLNPIKLKSSSSSLLKKIANLHHLPIFIKFANFHHKISHFHQNCQFASSVRQNLPIFTKFANFHQ